jgi:hypothetical protein
VLIFEPARITLSLLDLEDEGRSRQGSVEELVDVNAPTGVSVR